MLLFFSASSSRMNIGKVAMLRRRIVLSVSKRTVLVSLATFVKFAKECRALAFRQPEPAHSSSGSGYDCDTDIAC